MNQAEGHRASGCCLDSIEAASMCVYFQSILHNHLTVLWEPEGITLSCPGARRLPKEDPLHGQNDKLWPHFCYKINFAGGNVAIIINFVFLLANKYIFAQCET